jgi:hypothetical protein
VGLPVIETRHDDPHVVHVSRLHTHLLVQRYSLSLPSEGFAKFPPLSLPAP